MEIDERKKQRRLSTAERKALRTRRQFRCEWCNRWSLGSKEEWFYVARAFNRWLPPTEMLKNRDGVMYMCKRGRCIVGRPKAFWWPGLYRPDGTPVVFGEDE